MLFAQGDRGFSCYVVISGAIEMFESSRGDPHIIVVHEAHQFTGDVDLLAGRASVVSARVVEDGELLELSASALRQAVDEWPELGEVVLKAFLMRRSMLLSDGFEGLKIVGSRFSIDAHRLRDFATRNAIPFTWIDVESNPHAEELLRQFGIPASETPVVVGREGRFLRRPSIEDLARCAGLDVTLDPAEVHDLIVVGAGPAGLAAAVYGASEGLDVLVLERLATGGQAGTSSRIENYLGFPAGISGAELTRNALLQAQRFGARIDIPGTVVRLGVDEGDRVPTLADGTKLRTRCILIATGVSYRRLDLPRFREFEGAGVYYAATEMEARLCRGDEVAVVGAGNSAGQAIVYLSRYARTVHVVVRGDDLGASMSRYLVDRVEHLENVVIHRSAVVSAVEGNGHLTGISVRNGFGSGDPAEHARPLHVHRGRSEHELAEWLHRAGREGLRADGSAAAARDRRERAVECDWTNAVPARNELAGSVRSRRRPQRLGQALRVGSGRGGDRGQLRAPAYREAALVDARAKARAYV